MNSSKKLPSEFTTPSLLGTMLLISFIFLEWLVPAYCLHALLFQSSLQLAVKVPVAVGLVFVAGIGLHNLGLLGHDGSHFNLHTNKIVSFVIGIVLSSLVPLHLDVGFALSHSRHHRFTNRAGDPDVEVLGSILSPWRRLFRARRALSLRYLISTWNLATGELGPQDVAEFPLGFQILRRLAILNIFCSVVFSLSYFLLLLLAPGWSLTVIVLPFAVAILIGGIRPFVEHANTEMTRRQNARSWTHWTMDLLFLGHNYHSAHHCYPNVPMYRLKRLHKWMEINEPESEDGLGKVQLNIEKSMFGFFGYIGSSYSYGPHQNQ